MRPRANTRTTGGASPAPRWRSLALSAALPLALLIGCSQTSVAPPIRIEERSRPIPRFHPPLPPAVNPPGEIEIEVVTPGVAAEWAGEIEAGRRAPYTVFAMDEQDYLTLARWLQDVLGYVGKLRAVVDYYREEKTP